MPVHQLGQLAGYKRISDWSNNTWQMGNHTGGKPQKCVISCYTTAEYTSDTVTHYRGHVAVSGS